MVVAAGESISAHERDFGVALALDAEGGVLVLAADIDVDILQRHVEGVVCCVVAREPVDDSDNVVGGAGGDVFGHGHEVFDRGLHDFGRLDLGLIVVIGVGDIEGCAGVHDLASRHGASALRAFGKGLAAGGVAGLGLVFLAAGGGAAGLVLFRGIGLVFLAAGGVAAGLVLFRGIGLVFLAAGGAVGLVFVFLVAGGVVAGLGLVFLVAGGVAGLVLVRGISLVFLAVVVRRVVALGGAEVDHVFAFAVF